MDVGRSARAARRQSTYEGGIVALADQQDADYQFWHAGADDVRLNAVLEMALAEISDEASSRFSRSVGGVRSREG